MNLQTVSTNDKCGPKNNYTICQGNACCSAAGECGHDNTFCHMKEYNKRTGEWRGMFDGKNNVRKYNSTMEHYTDNQGKTSSVKTIVFVVIGVITLCAIYMALLHYKLIDQNAVRALMFMQ